MARRASLHSATVHSTAARALAESRIARQRPHAPPTLPTYRGTALQHCACASNPNSNPSPPPGMDITKFVVDRREAAFLVGDHATYREQLSRRLRIVRKKLGRATPKNAKYTPKDAVTAGEIGANVEYVALL